jgi:hypothetical protein
MPTFSAAWDRHKRGLGEDGISLLDKDGDLLPVVPQILKTIKKYEMVVATGHISLAEIKALVDAAIREGITRIVITHALEPHYGATLNVAEQAQLAARGVFIEHCYLSTLPSGGGLGTGPVVRAVRAVGAAHCILTTDLGQRHNPSPAPGLRAYLAILLEGGLDELEIEMMVKTNPARLLGLA